MNDWRVAIKVDMPYLEVFVYLQFLDFMTTLVGFGLGGREVSPFTRLLMGLGPITGVVLAKLIAFALAGYCIWRRKQRVVRWINYFFAALVAWNLVQILKVLVRV